MTEQNDSQPAAKSMDDIVSLCRRRGFIWGSSEIYGGLNGFWDYGPLGCELKRNLINAWWEDLVTCPPDGPDGHPMQIVGVDCTTIMNPKVWEASGHVEGFNDPMVDCRETKSRYRADHLEVYKPTDGEGPWFAFMAGEGESVHKKMKKIAKRSPDAYEVVQLVDLPVEAYANIIGPDHNKPGSLTEPRLFNMMFETYIGAIRNEDSKSYLRPETAQGIFTQFWNVVDTSRVKVPFGIAQVGKAYRNEVTPRNFIFRSREFEQMEVEFFIHPDEAKDWLEYWTQLRFNWWQAVGLRSDNLQLRSHEQDELAHYAKEGAGTSDIEYRFPFTAPGFGELEGVSHRADFDLRRHAEFCGKGEKLRYFDQEKGERYFPHVIEPSGGATRGTLAVLCEAYTPDPSRPSKVYLKFHPRLAPIKAAVFPLVNKDGMPERAEALYKDLRREFTTQFDVKQNIGKRYARMDEAGTPYCVTVDSDTLADGTVTVRERDTTDQQRINIDQVASFLRDRIRSV
jgi:glycyl-tRNA synthetase